MLMFPQRGGGGDFLHISLSENEQASLSHTMSLDQTGKWRGEGWCSVEGEKVDGSLTNLSDFSHTFSWLVACFPITSHQALFFPENSWFQWTPLLQFPPQSAVIRDVKSWKHLPLHHRQEGVRILNETSLRRDRLGLPPPPCVSVHVCTPSCSHMSAFALWADFVLEHRGSMFIFIPWQWKLTIGCFNLFCLFVCSKERFIDQEGANWEVGSPSGTSTPS